MKWVRIFQVGFSEGDSLEGGGVDGWEFSGWGGFSGGNFPRTWNIGKNVVSTFIVVSRGAAPYVRKLLR